MTNYWIVYLRNNSCSMNWHIIRCTKNLKNSQNLLTPLSSQKRLFVLNALCRKKLRFFMKSSSKQLLAQSLQNIPLCTNTVLHSFSWRCLLVLTFFLPDDTAKHHHSRTVQRFLLQFREVWVIAVRRARKPEAAKGCPQFWECNLYRKICQECCMKGNMHLFFDIVVQQYPEICSP